MNGEPDIKAEVYQQGKRKDGPDNAEELCLKREGSDDDKPLVCLL